tara:strand:- start:1117 stop:2106 length:990 start_codon:yes stop_codon:yes gene_type:complete
MKTKNNNSLLLEAIEKNYDSVKALKGVSLKIHPGEFCTLLGASGSGKSTILRVIAGFETLDSGRLEINDEDMSKMSIAERNIGMVFQNYALFPHMDVFQNIAFGLEMRKLDKSQIKEKVNEVLELVGLTNQKKRLPSELSGGQQQRVALARAIVIEPKILLMDEPLGALDKNLRNDMQKQIKNLHKNLNITVVYVTHDQDEAMFLSDKIVLMDEGKIIQTGTCEELYTNPKNRFVANFLGECNFFTLDSGKKISIRPECLRISGDNKNDRNSFQVDVEDVVFQGRMIKLIGNYNEQEIIASISPLEYELESNHKDKIFLTYDSESLMNI